MSVRFGGMGHVDGAHNDYLTQDGCNPPDRGGNTIHLPQG